MGSLHFVAGHLLVRNRGVTEITFGDVHLPVAAKGASAAALRPQAHIPIRNTLRMVCHPFRQIMLAGFARCKPQPRSVKASQAVAVIANMGGRYVSFLASTATPCSQFIR
jgi:hypothetical protein